MTITNNIDRLKMELRGYSSIPDSELIIYLLENDLVNTDVYDTKSKTNLKKIYQTALAILESIANDPQMMKNYKTEDLTITHFHTNLMNRIDDLRRKISTMVTDEMVADGDAKIIPFIW